MPKNGSRAYRWYVRYSEAELVALGEHIKAENPAQPGVHYDGIYLYSKAVRAKFDDIARAISFHEADRRRAAGIPHNPDQEIGIGKRHN